MFIYTNLMITERPDLFVAFSRDELLNSKRRKVGDEPQESFHGWMVSCLKSNREQGQN